MSENDAMTIVAIAVIFFAIIIAIVPPLSLQAWLANIVLRRWWQWCLIVIIPAYGLIFQIVVVSASAVSVSPTSSRITPVVIVITSMIKVIALMIIVVASIVAVVVPVTIVVAAIAVIMSFGAVTMSAIAIIVGVVMIVALSTASRQWLWSCWPRVNVTGPTSLVFFVLVLIFYALCLMIHQDVPSIVIVVDQTPKILFRSPIVCVDDWSLSWRISMS